MFLILYDELIVGHDNMELRFFQRHNAPAAPHLSQQLALLLTRAKVWDDFELRTKAAEFLVPVVHRRGGSNHQERAPYVLCLGQVCEQGYGLHGLSESHLVRKKSIHTLFVEGDEPVEALELIRFESTGEDGGCRRGDVFRHGRWFGETRFLEGLSQSPLVSFSGTDTATFLHIRVKSIDVARVFFHDIACGKFSLSLNALLVLGREFVVHGYCRCRLPIVSLHDRRQ
mmetsp:Transcript_31951/g.75126  ORF Transcript_31951/g.75126 Transcript_31951/m.75126 type:complete len:228 (-) Transcript_31951:394-1077(-)